MNLYSHAARALASHRSLPATRVTGASPYLGATRPRGNRVPPVFADVMGTVAIKMIRNPDGSVTTTLRVNSKYADFMTRADLETLQDFADDAANDARRLSRGGKSLKDLRRMGHPYAVGRRGKLGRLRGSGHGISNRAIVNEQSGDFGRSWHGEATLHKSGADITVHSADRKSGWLAFGTTHMKAHYPGPTVMARLKFTVQRKWQQMARAAKARDLAMQGLQGERAPVAL